MIETGNPNWGGYEFPADSFPVQLECSHEHVVLTRDEFRSLHSHLDRNTPKFDSLTTNVKLVVEDTINAQRRAYNKPRAEAAPPTPPKAITRRVYSWLDL